MDTTDGAMHCLHKLWIPVGYLESENRQMEVHISAEKSKNIIDKVERIIDKGELTRDFLDSFMNNTLIKDNTNSERN